MILDAATLERAGIHASPEQFVRSVLRAVETVGLARVVTPGAGLTEDQIALLREGGIDPLIGDREMFGLDGPIGRGAAAYAALLATSLSVPETAARLGVDESRIRQKIHSRTLYAVKSGATWRVLAFQIVGKSSRTRGPNHHFKPRGVQVLDPGDVPQADLIPGIERVLPRLDPNLSPLTVITWFWRANPNLVSPDGTAWSPTDWLLVGNPVAPVAESAASVGRGV